MVHQRILAIIIGISQFALALALFVFPDEFFKLFGFSPAAADQKYLYGQLAARFLAFGIGMFVIAKNPLGNRTWWNLMALIQGLDLMIGLVYVLGFGVPWTLALFPMFNAALFALLLVLWRPKNKDSAN